MPAKMTMPMSTRVTAPAPEATISGTMPTTIAAVVIRIGRRRTPAASSIASRRERPRGLLQPVGEIDHQDAVLGDQADQGHQADLGVDVDARRSRGRRRC